MVAYADDFAAADLSASTTTDIYTPASPQVSGLTFSCIVVNRGASAANVQLGISSTSVTFENARRITDDGGEEVAAGGRMIISGLAMGGDKYFIAESDSANVSVMLTGIVVPA